MAVKTNPNLINELKPYGLPSTIKCMQCGNCTGICPLSDRGEYSFPRKFMRYVQLGLTDKIMNSPAPWLCYYCGDCTVRCPRDADPGETMMAMRRWLTAQYDWTGFSRKFYTSHVFEYAAIVVVALVVGALLLISSGPWVTERVALNTVWPAHLIEVGDLFMAAILSFFLLSNVYRCAKITMGDLWGKVPLETYFGSLKDLILHTVTQKRFGKCHDKQQWIVHLLIMTGYSSLFLMVVVGIRWFQRDSVIMPEYKALSLIMTLVGYYATAALLYGTTYAMIGRWKKTKPPYKYSHPTDWIFLFLLQATTLTGILVHVFIALGWPIPTYLIYLVHMMIAVPMLVLEVPFAKWSHLAYRPVVIYLIKVRDRYLEDNPGAIKTN